MVGGYRRLMVSAVLAMFVAFSVGACTSSQAPRQKPAQKSEAKKPVEQKAAVFPAAVPDMTRGKVVFERDCVSCHGSKGDGKGPSASGLKEPPANFTDKAFVRRHRPNQFFDVITDGEGPMPGFKSSLSEQDRWNVLYYARLFATSDEEIAQGKVIYEKNCASCHGAAGKGDGAAGAKLTPKPANLTDQAFLARHSDNQFFEVVSEGEGPMPGFKATLSEDERRQVLAYERSFGYMK